MTDNLVIVESPAKAKTIEKYLGKDFTVRSSYGHIRDLPKKGMSIDIENGFVPTYEVNDDKKKTVTELKKLAKTATTVWLASDEDREGEAIAWHLAEALKLDEKKTKRIVFHEITKPAILKAIENPRTVDKNLVDAQQARRVLDRLVGYELSPVLWKKIRTGLSAGRVQSVSVRIIVEREREIRSFEANSSFRIQVHFDLGSAILMAELGKRFDNYDDAKAFIEAIQPADFTVKSLVTKPGKKSPAAPFTTSTLQQEASRKLGFSVKQTMSVAQKLYESGQITYMRTDSVNLSEIALEQAEEMIKKNYGSEYHEARKFKTKNSDAQEAHEAIRPTDMNKQIADGDGQAARLYDLIWKRTVASQMAEAKLEKTTATIDISTRDEDLVASGEVLKFDGFLKVYLEGTDDEEDDSGDEKMLPPMNEGQKLEMKEINGKEMFSRPPARFTEASLVKKLEEMGIGRPSTYAPTISTVQDRGYVEKTDRPAQKRAVRYIAATATDLDESAKQENFGAEKNKLFPTDIGEVVTDFLVKHFEDVIDFGFTRKVEEEFDQVAEGKQVWNKMIGDFYGGFHKLVEDSGGIDRAAAAGDRALGKDPKSGLTVIARIGRFGPMVQIGTQEELGEDKKPQFASIPAGKTIAEVTLEEALEQFQFPKMLGQLEGEDVKVNNGRFGPYAQLGKTYASLKKASVDDDGNEILGDDLGTITLERAIELIKEKQEKDKNKFVQVWEEEDIQLLRGPYGIYIKHAKKNFRIPKDVEAPEKLTLEACQKIIKEGPVPKKRKAPAKKK